METPQNNHYNKSLRHFANSNRKEMTKAEACIWKYVLSKRQMLGYQFRRQRPVLNYIADFMCQELKLIIEVDGLTHQWEEVNENDIVRQQRLEDLGFTVIRFDDRDVLKQINLVAKRIEDAIYEINSKIQPL